MKYITKFKDIEIQKGNIYIGLMLDKHDMFSGDIGDVYQLTIFTKDSPIYNKFNKVKKLYSLEYKKYKEFRSINDLIDYLDETETYYDIRLLKRGVGKYKKKNRQRTSIADLLMEGYNTTLDPSDSEEISEILMNYIDK